jgi:hypothetical protein
VNESTPSVEDECAGGFFKSTVGAGVEEVNRFGETLESMR